VWGINETTRRVSAPNPDLGPEKSKNFSLRLAKYFEPSGQFAVNFFQNNIKGLYQTNELTAEEYGPVDTGYDFSGYTFVTTTQSSDDVTVRGMEIEYAQALSFLPDPLDGLGIRASYTRSSASVPMTLIVPHSFSAGLNYSYRKFSTYANWVWNDTNLQAIGTVTRAYRHEGKIDLGGTYKFNERWSVYFYVRNLLEAPRVLLEQSGSNPWITYGYYTDDASWTFGGRCRF
jgi:outer membrane receptor protein involved in Fe transport